MARNEQLIRQHKILQILERFRFGRLLEEIRDDLVDELGLTSLHPRSVRRDLQALQAAGLDVDVHDSPRGRVWKLGRGTAHSQKIAVSATELIALSLSRDLLYPLVGTPFWQGIESFWHKLRETLPDSVWRHYQKYRQVLGVRGATAKSYESQQGVLKTLHRGMMEHRVVEIDYQPIGKDTQRRRIEPYAVVFYQSSLYIVAAAAEAPAGQDRIRHWKLDRFRKAVALDEWFQPPEDFNLQRHLAPSLGIFSAAEAHDYRIRVSAYAAPWILEDPWSPEQQVERLPDGGVILTVKAAHELEIIPRVLALGRDAEVLSPDSCRRSIASVIRQMAAAYQDTAPP
jgi:predicted DNA-binding transcriptional regulator YafY